MSFPPDLPYLTPLGAAELARAGLPPEWRYGLRDIVRFFEIDALNHVNHTRYLTWFEGFRLPYLRDYGISSYGPDGPRLVLRSVEADYRAEMHEGDDYIVAGRTAWFGTSSFRMDYAVFAPDLRVTGAALVVLRSADGRAKWPLTEAQKTTLRTRDGALPRA